MDHNPEKWWATWIKPQLFRSSPRAWWSSRVQPKPMSTRCSGAMATSVGKTSTSSRANQPIWPQPSTRQSAAAIAIFISWSAANCIVRSIYNPASPCPVTTTPSKKLTETPASSAMARAPSPFMTWLCGEDRVMESTPVVRAMSLSEI